MSHKKRQKHSQPFKLLFFTINLHFLTSYQIPTYRTPNFPQSSSIYLVLLPLKMQGRLKETTQNETTHKPLKVAAAKTIFSSAYVYKLLQWMFFILCDNRKTLLSIIVSHYFEIAVTTVLLLFLKPLFRRKSLFYVLFPQSQ